MILSTSMLDSEPGETARSPKRGRVTARGTAQRRGDQAFGSIGASCFVGTPDAAGFAIEVYR